MSQIKLIVALANPGVQYAQTRHNAGEWLMSRLADKYRLQFKVEAKFFAQTAKTVLYGNEVRFLIPTTFMNLSGQAVGAVANFFRILPEEILVLHDELDLPVGSVKLKQGGGHGGHNGLKDIMAKLANQKNFYRLRIGIGHPGDRHLVTSYVLGKPLSQDIQRIDQALDRATDSVDVLLKQGITYAMNRLNGFKAKNEINNKE